jgi:hypothetical protein
MRAAERRVFRWGLDRAMRDSTAMNAHLRFAPLAAPLLIGGCTFGPMVDPALKMAMPEFRNETGQQITLRPISPDMYRDQSITIEPGDSAVVRFYAVRLSENAVVRVRKGDSHKEVTVATFHRKLDEATADHDTFTVRSDSSGALAIESDGKP